VAIITVTGRKPRVTGSDGHGMSTYGKRSPKLPNGIKSETGDFMHENEFNRAVEKYYGEELRRCGFDYLSLAPGDDDVSLSERDRRSDAFKADFHIDIHANAFDSDWDVDAKGIETFYYGGSKQSIEAAKVVHRHVMGGTPMTNRGVKDGSGLYMLKNTAAVAVLVELGFMDSIEDIRSLLSDSYRRECAVELAVVTCEIFGIPYISVQEKSQSTVTPQTQSQGIGVLKVLDTTVIRDKPVYLGAIMGTVKPSEEYIVHDYSDGWYNIGGWVSKQHVIFTPHNNAKITKG
jgi:N-acetylmuramoyl-L-alanine amidase